MATFSRYDTPSPQGRRKKGERRGAATAPTVAGLIHCFQQWRHSNFGNYYIHDIQAKTTHPIIPPTDPSKTAYAIWSPTGSAIAYVTENDIYILPDAL